VSKNANLFFRFCIWLFLAGVVTQVTLAGLTVVAAQIDWSIHKELGHIIGLPLYAMAVTMYVAKAGSEVKRTTWLLLLVFILQTGVTIFMRFSSAPVVYLSALHPVLALFDFWLGVRLLGLTKASKA
jgi:hypothetical protein